MKREKEEGRERGGRRGRDTDKETVESPQSMHFLAHLECCNTEIPRALDEKRRRRMASMEVLGVELGNLRPMFGDEAIH